MHARKIMLNVLARLMLEQKMYLSAGSPCVLKFSEGSCCATCVQDFSAPYKTISLLKAKVLSSEVFSRPVS